MPLLEFKEYSLAYASAPVLNGLSFSVQKGEFVGLLGNVGSGKTSLLYSINGILPHLLPATRSGTVTLAGLDVSKHSVQELSRHLGFVFQNPDDQIFNLTVREEIAFGLENHKLEKTEVERRVAWSLGQVGLQGFEERDPHSLSQGQKQKVAVASAIALQNDFLVLDEPTSSLDHRSSLELYALLGQLHEQGTTILVVDHDTDLLSAHAQRFLVLDGGRIVLDGGKEIFRRPEFARAGLKVPCDFEHAKN